VTGFTREVCVPIAGTTGCSIVRISINALIAEIPGESPTLVSVGHIGVLELKCKKLSKKSRAFSLIT